MTDIKLQNTLYRHLIVGFSGHRNITNKHLIQKVIERELEKLKLEFTKITTISSVASGADTLFLSAANKQEIPTHIILPFEKKRFRNDFCTKDWLQAERLINRATDVKVNKSTGSHDCQHYLEAGLLTLKGCNILMTVWNGKPSKGLGGTGDIVAYARQIKKPLLIIDDETGYTTWSNWK